MEIKKKQVYSLTTRDLTLSASMAAVYIVSSVIPLTRFIGGAAFITLEIVMVPIIAAILRPVPATVSILSGSIGAAIFQTVLGVPGLYQVFGLPGLLIPVIGAVSGSLAFHYRWGPLVPWAYVLTGAAYYVLFSKGGTLLWLIPYIIVVVMLPLALKTSGTKSTGLLALYTTMSELVTMNVLSIGVLGLPGGVWSIITPFMFLERTVATLGATSLIVALKSRIGTAVQLGRPVLREVN